MHDLAGDIGQAFIASVVEIRQSFVIHAEKMQDCRVQVMHMHFSFGGS